MSPLSPSSTKVIIEDDVEDIEVSQSFSLDGIYTWWCLPWQDENTPLKSIKEIEEEREAEKKREQRFVSSEFWDRSVNQK